MSKNYKKIYIVCPDNKKPSGGVKQLYRFADVLNQNGYNAVILHNKKSYKVKWFINTTKVEFSNYFFKILNNTLRGKKPNAFSKIKLLAYKKTSPQIEKDAVIIVPEIYTFAINSIEPEVDKIIFNQNCYYTFRGNPINTDKVINPYESKKTVATIVASEDAENYINYTFPDIRTYRMRLGINAEIFNFSKNKKPQIAFMPRKLRDDVEQVINILKIRNNIKGWSFVEIDNMSESEVARILKESTVFLSFNHREGFGLPPVEAMACGCVVVGYEGGAGKEYFLDDFSFSVEEGNIIDFVKKTEYIINHFSDRELSEMGKKASDFVLHNYSIENEKNDIITIWKDIISN